MCINCAYFSTCQAQEELVVRITASDCGYPGSNILTGFILKDKGIVTALHGVCGCNSIGLENASGNLLGKALVTEVDLKNDVALLTPVQKIDLSEGFVFSDASLSSLSSKNVTIIGYGHKVPKPKTSERCNVRRTPVRKLIDCIPKDIDITESLRQRGSPSLKNDVLDIEATIMPGCSGSPIIYNREVVGIADGGLMGGSTAYCWAIPASLVKFAPKSSLETDYSNLSKKNPNSIFHSAGEKFDKENAVTLFRIGLNEYENGSGDGKDADYLKALDFFDESIRLMPLPEKYSLPEVYYYRGNTYKMINDHKIGKIKNPLDLAIKDFKEALGLNYRNAETSINIGHCKCLIGKKEEGLREINQVLNKRADLREMGLVKSALKDCGGRE